MPNFPNIGHSWSENWLFKLANDNSTFLYLAFQDETYSSDFYEGAILNKPSIRESINLSNSTAKTGNISITIADYDYNGSPISEELFGGSNHYINQTVTVHSRVNAETPEPIGNYRLTDISTNGNKISLSMTSQRPWDFITFPQTKTTNKIYEPIVYGDFTGNASSGFCTSKALFPVHQESFASNNSYYVAHRSLDNASGNETTAHWYETGIDRFVPISDTETSTLTDESIELVVFPTIMERTFKFRPIKVKSNNGFSDPENAFDISPTSKAYHSVTGHGSISTYKYLKLESPELTGICTALSLTITAISEITTANNPPGEYAKLRFRSYGLTDEITDFSNEYDDTGSDSSSAYNNKNILSDYQGNGNVFDEIFIESLILFSSGGSGSYAGSNQIKDIQFLATMDLSDPESTSAQKSNGQRKVIEGKKVYLGCDGLSNGITGLSGTITEIHEAHLDLLHRFTGLDVAENPSENIDGWSELDTVRNGWNIRFWELEPVDLKKTLEKLQYEGGFIFRFKSDGSPQYIHIANSPSVDFTLGKNDIKDISVKPDSFGNLLTKMDIEYEKHPAENRHLTSVTSSNSTSRANWNIKAKENIKQTKLDAYVAPVIPTSPNANPNNDFYSYYDNIFGDIKLQVSGTLVNPNYYSMDVGDILNFSDMHPDKAFGQSWSGKNFMIISLTRSMGTLKFEAREI